MQCFENYMALSFEHEKSKNKVNLESLIVAVKSKYNRIPNSRTPRETQIGSRNGSLRNRKWHQMTLNEAPLGGV